MHFSSFLLLLLGVMHGCIAALVLRSQPLNHTGGGCPDQNRISIGGSVTSGILLQSLPNFSIDIENYSEEMYTSQCTAYVNITFSEPGHLIDLNTDGGNMSGWLYKNSDSWDTHLKITYEWVGQTGQVRYASHFILWKVARQSGRVRVSIEIVSLTLKISLTELD